MQDRQRPTLGPDEITSQATSKKWRERVPISLRQVVNSVFPPKTDQNFQLIDPEKLREHLVKKGLATEENQEAIDTIIADMKWMDREIHELFLQRDAEASHHQSRYRRQQIIYMVLALLATIVGSLQALALDGVLNEGGVLYFSYFETLIALIATFVATIAADRPAFPEWMKNRNRSEKLRQEYYRYLLNGYPYTDLNDIDRRLLLSSRAAKINRGQEPDVTRSEQSS